ncbi:MAG: glycosyltransferase family 4 protein, partial [Rhodanobacteraceae bacterium]
PVLSSAHVPAAEPQQRLPLDLAAWAQEMGEVGQFTSKNPSVDALAAGKALFEVLTRVRSRKSLQIPKRTICSAPLAVKPVPIPIPVATAGRPSASVGATGTAGIIGYRADWHSPSGFGEAARRMGLALEAAGLDWKPIGVPKDSIQRTALFPAKVERGLDQADVWIHHLPPDHFDFTKPGRHIGVFAWETDRLTARDIPGGRNWIEALNRMDEIWVPSQGLVKVLADSGVRSPAHWMPHPIDTAFYSPGARRPPCVLPPRFDPTWTVFLYVGTWDVRKRPDVLVRAFSRAFNARDRTLLLIKTYMTGDAEQDQHIASKWVGEHARGDAHIRALTGVYTPEQMRNLYRFVTVFVTASRGEGFCLPAVEAMSCGKPVISTGWSAFADYPGVQVPYRLEPLPAEHTFPGYAADQNWAVIDENALVEALRWAHQNRAALLTRGAEAQAWVRDHCGVALVANRLKERLAVQGGKA